MPRDIVTRVSVRHTLAFECELERPQKLRRLQATDVEPRELQFQPSMLRAAAEHFDGLRTHGSKRVKDARETAERARNNHVHGRRSLEFPEAQSFERGGQLS